MKGDIVAYTLACEKWIHIWKAIITFLRRIASATTLSAHFGFSGVYPVFSIYETQMIVK